LKFENDLSRYLKETRTFPMLSAEQEQELARRWRHHRDPEALSQLVGSHLRLVVKMARGFTGYGMPLSDLISEGNVGLMQAAERFDPERGFRFATYASWWIRAAIQEYILHSQSLVKMGTTAAQKKLFFNLQRLKSRMHAFAEGDLAPETVSAIARQLEVPESQVVEMNRRLAGGDQSLNATRGADTRVEWEELLIDDSPDQETTVAEREEFRKRLALMDDALGHLSERERHILNERRLRDDPRTLEELSQHYGISRERVRQIEARALEKLQASVRNTAKAAGLWGRGGAGSRLAEFDARAA
jgi:RNA polymerase sigma-32 factor